MRKLLHYLKPYMCQVTLGPVFKLIEAIFELIVPLVIADMIDVGVKSGNNVYVLQRGGILLALGLVGLLSSLTCQYMASVASQGVGTDLRNTLFAHIQSLSHKELDMFDTPTLVTRMTSDINQLQLAVAMLIRLVVRAPFLAVGAAVMAIRIDLQLSLVLLAVMPLIAVLLYIIMGRSVPFYKVIQKKLDAIARITRENLSGVRVVRAFGTQDREEKRFQDACNDQADVTIRIGRLSAWLSPLSFAIMNLGIVAILWFGGVRVNSGNLTQGQLVAFVNYMTQILLALVVVANLVVIFTKASASAARVNAIFDVKTSMEDSATEPVIALPNAPRISFSNVSFRYGQSGENALKHASFDVYPGQTIGIIGGTGSGKSTLVSLIPRLYDASQGSVLIDGVDVRNYPFKQLREKIGIVPQQVMLFSGTVAENLRWRKADASDKEIEQALKTAQALSFVNALSEKLDTKILPGGKDLSGGQRQRLTIARALVGKPEILILDDSASALDYATDAALRQALKLYAKESTVLIVSQRVASVRWADMILVMDEGEIVGQGTHEQLIQTCSVYRETSLSQQGAKEAAV